jgi:4-hydroxybenzoate polyprenyltransferase
MGDEGARPRGGGGSDRLTAAGPLRTAVALAKCSHPDAVAAVTVLCGLLASTTGRGPLGTVAVVSAVLAGQLFVGWQNDYLDRVRDAAAERGDKPLAAGRVNPRTVRAAAAVALVAAVFLSLLSGGAAAAAHYVGIAMAVLYNLGLKATPASVVPYAIAFALLPAFITLGPPIQRPPAAWAAPTGAALGAGAHFMQVLPDLDRERAEGVGGLPQLLGARASAITGAALLSLAVVLVSFGPTRQPSAPVLAATGLSVAVVAGVAAVALTRRTKLAFRLTLVAAFSLLLAYAAGPRTLV